MMAQTWLICQGRWRKRKRNCFIGSRLGLGHGHSALHQAMNLAHDVEPGEIRHADPYGVDLAEISMASSDDNGRQGPSSSALAFAAIASRLVALRL
jgi:hypothetical protein